MANEGNIYHIPVLLKESVDGMNISPSGIYVDMTFGGGGHSKEILSRLDENGRLLGFDQDEDAESNIPSDKRFIFVRSNFRYLHNFLRYHNIDKVDAILADLGVSSHHFDDSERGFSFRFSGALDMRMNKRSGITAADKSQGEQYKLAHWALNQMGYISEALSELDIQNRTDDTMKAQILLGYLAREEQLDKPKGGNK